MKTTLETSGKCTFVISSFNDLSGLTETMGDMTNLDISENILETSGKDVKTTLETSGKDVKYTLETRRKE